MGLKVYYLEEHTRIDAKECHSAFASRGTGRAHRRSDRAGQSRPPEVTWGVWVSRLVEISVGRKSENPCFRVKNVENTFGSSARN